MLFEVLGGGHNKPLKPLRRKGVLGNVAYAWLKLFLEGNNCYCGILSVDSFDQNSTSSKYLTNLNCSSL